MIVKRIRLEPGRIEDISDGPADSGLVNNYFSFPQRRAGQEISNNLHLFGVAHTKGQALEMFHVETLFNFLAGGALRVVNPPASQRNSLVMQNAYCRWIVGLA